MSLPDTLLYPTEFIQVTTNNLKRELRKIYRLVKKGVVLAPNDAMSRGEEAIDKEFKSYVARINGYLKRHNLKAITGEEPGIQIPFKESKRLWARIVDDMFRA